MIYGATAATVIGPVMTVASSLLLFSGAAQFTMVGLIGTMSTRIEEARVVRMPMTVDTTGPMIESDHPRDATVVTQRELVGDETSEVLLSQGGSDPHALATRNPGSQPEVTRQQPPLDARSTNTRIAVDTSPGWTTWRGALRVVAHQPHLRKTLDTVAIRRGYVPGNEELTAVLAVCREIAADQGCVDDATWQAVLEAGWSDRQLLEAYAEVVRTVLTTTSITSSARSWTFLPLPSSTDGPVDHLITLPVAVA